MVHRIATRRAFTLIEIVLGAVVATVMVALSMPLFLSGAADASMKQCRSDMMTIGNLERQHRLKDPNHAYTTSLSTLKTEMLTPPVCPGGGNYTITLSNGSMTAQNGQTVPAGRPIISCSVAGHGKYAPDFDMN